MKKSELRKIIKEIISEQSEDMAIIPPHVVDAGINIYVYKCPDGYEFMNPIPGGGSSLFNVMEGNIYGHYVVSRGCTPKKVFDPNKEKDPVRGIDTGTSGPFQVD